MAIDPCAWTVAQVQHFFRHDAKRFISSRSGSQLPPIDQFEQLLAEKEVNGSSLLDIPDIQTLLQEFGIQSINIRFTLLHLIRLLRSQSQEYQSRSSDPTLHTSTSPAITPLLSAPQPLLLQPHAEFERVSTRPRQSEEEIVDEHGRKRRRLNLAKQTEEDEDALAAATAQRAVSAPGSYLPDGVLSLEQLFFGDTALGQELEDFVNGSDFLVDNPDPGAEDDDFQLLTRPVQPGEADFVYSCMRHYLSAPAVVDLTRRKHSAVAVLPYQEAKAIQAPCAIVVQLSEGSTYIARREQVSLLHAGYEIAGLKEQSNGDWDFLLDRYKPEEASDAVLPSTEDLEAASDSDSETELGARDDEALEDAEDSLLQSHIGDAVNSLIADYVSRWHRDILPSLEAKRAWSVWRQMKKSISLRDALISSANTQIEHLSKRLTKLKDELCASEWSTRESLSRAFGSLEPTIEDIETQKWKISVWHRRQEPAHTVRHGTGKGSMSKASGRDTESARSSFVVHSDDRLSVLSGGKAPVVRQSSSWDNHSLWSNGPLVQIGTDNEDFDASDEMSPVESQLAEGIFDAMEGTDDEVPQPQTQTQPATVLQITSPQPTKEEIIPTATSSRASPMDESSSESDLPDISKIVKTTKQREIPARSIQGTRKEPIVVSSDSGGGHSAKANRPKAAQSKKAMPKVFTVLPEEHTAQEVDDWDLVELMNRNDRKRLLIKLLREAGPQKRENIQSLSLSLGNDFEPRLKHMIDLIASNPEFEFDSQRDEGAEMAYCAKMALIWYIAKPDVQRVSPQTRVHWQQLRDDPHQINMFVNLFRPLLRKIHTKLFCTPRPSPSNAYGSDSSQVVVLSNSEGGSPGRRTPRKKRKRAIQESQAVTRKQNAALAKDQSWRAAMESQPMASSTQIAALDPGDPSKSGVTINPVREDGFSPIYILPRIAKKMKDYQIDGVRFLWRKITEKDDEGDDWQGALLAHTMGLGKTIQTIALLVALVEASESEDESIYRQLPPHLRMGELPGKRQLRMLVLCPPALIKNWQNEVQRWAPSKLGNMFVVEAGNKNAQLRRMEDWYRVGGLMLIGYALFRTFVIRKGKRSEVLDGEKLDTILLQGPDIVVADEAHNLKNEESDIAKAASRIKAVTRIALTGTPMSNHVHEIYAMVSWIAPGYLGERTEFKANFIEPIAEGLFEDSTPAEVRKMKKKLAVLQENIRPKVDRRGITVLRGSLKPKVEFVVTVDLTQVQKTLYTRCVAALLSDADHYKANQLTLFSWFSLLMLVTNHPAVFREQILTPAAPKKARKGTCDEASDLDAGADVPEVSEDATTEQVLALEANLPPIPDNHALGFTEAVVNEILKDVPQDLDPSLSAKMLILLEVVKLSIACGDKVLVFTGRLPTIRYVEQLLRSEGVTFGIIAGSIAASKRTELIDAFNNSNSKMDVMLISTKAGGVGLNIQAANRVVLLDFGFNPMWEEQAIGRAYRLGQTKPVWVYRFVAGGTFETQLYNKQLHKNAITQRVVDKKNTKRTAQRDTRQWLYEPKPVRQQDLEPEIGKDPLVLDKILQRHVEGQKTLIRGLTTMETLQEDAQEEDFNEEERAEVAQEIQMGRAKQRRHAVGTGYMSNGFTMPVAAGIPFATQYAPPPTPLVAQDAAPPPTADTALQPRTPIMSRSPRPSSSTAPLPTVEPSQGNTSSELPPLQSPPQPPQ